MEYFISSFFLLIIFNSTTFLCSLHQKIQFRFVSILFISKSFVYHLDLYFFIQLKSFKEKDLNDFFKKTFTLVLLHV